MRIPDLTYITSLAFCDHLASSPSLYTRTEKQNGMSAAMHAARRRSFGGEDSPGGGGRKARQSPEPEEQHSTFANLAQGYPSNRHASGTAHQSRQTSGQAKHRPQPASHHTSSTNVNDPNHEAYNRLEAGPGTPVPPSPKSPALTGVSPPGSPGNRLRRDVDHYGASRGIAGRVVRSIKRGNLPFIMLFVA